MNTPEFGADGAMKWEQVVPPVWWAAASRHVVADRHLPDGQRQHMVSGHVQAGTVIDNAQVIGEADAVGAEFSSNHSHLCDA